MFRLSETALDAGRLKARLERPEAGACVTFEGWVRNHNEGRTVHRLEYEAYSEVALKEGARVLDEAKERFRLYEAVCVHRVGTLAIGDMAVWVGVSSAHRGESFEACRYIIDEIKVRLPIWKKEHYTDGDSGWVNCERCAQHGHHRHSDDPKPKLSEAAYYARQMRLSEVGEAGQAKLRESKVLLIGTGGLGSPAALYLAAAGVGRIGLCEGDRLEASNLHRQILYDHDGIGASKGEQAADRLRALNPFIDVAHYDQRLDAENAQKLVDEYDIVLDCTDNFETKFLISDAAVLTRTPAVFSSIYQFEGQVQVYRPGGDSPCLRCLWPTMPQAGCVGTCAEVGVLGAVPGVFGTLQAVETLKLLLDLPGALTNEVLLMDCLHYGVQKVKAKRRADCPACGEAASLNALSADQYAVIDECEVVVGRLDADELAAFEIVDIREPHEIALKPLEGYVDRVLPMSQIDPGNLPFDPDGNYLFCCAHGIRSLPVAKRLRELGIPKSYSLKGGVPELLRLSPTR